MPRQLMRLTVSLAAVALLHVGSFDSALAQRRSRPAPAAGVASRVVAPAPQ